MKPLDLNSVRQFVNENINEFHQNKIRRLTEIELRDLLRKKNPYLFKAKNLNVAADLIRDILDAHLSSSEEKLFGDFLERLAVFVASQTCDGKKSASTGIDLDFANEGVRYLVSIKSGTNWGNSSQQDKQEQDFQTAVRVVKQANRSLNVQPVLGICYGKTKTTFLRGYMKVVGQNFWYLISGNERLYIDIVEPIGYKAQEHNLVFNEQKAGIINRFSQEIIEEFCNPSGLIDWEKLVAYNSGNLDLDT